MIKVTCLPEDLETLVIRNNKLRSPDDLTKQTMTYIRNQAKIQKENEKKYL